MIRTLVDSAFQTGYLSVASEGLIRQVLTTKIYQPEDLVILADLWDAVRAGKVKREGSSDLTIELLKKFQID
ncbi:MAG: hypothetical protein QNJ63_03715 [Calothrix sp. MO_192.B10]|nr:hypothetical protein [Calothrix sp. MO_192.B10]